MRTLIALSEDEEHSEGAGTNRWMVSYADFITLLFVLFLALYARMPKLAEDGVTAPSGRQAQTARDARPASQHVLNGHVETAAQAVPHQESQLPTPRPAAPAETQLPTPAPAAPIPAIVAQPGSPAAAAQVAPAANAPPAQSLAANAPPAQSLAANAPPAAASAPAPANTDTRIAPLPSVAAPAAARRAPQYPGEAPRPLEPNSKPVVPNHAAPVEGAPQTLADRLGRSLADQVANGNLTLAARRDATVIEIADTSLFGAGTAQPTSLAPALIGRIAQIVGGSNAKVVIEGHTDNQQPKNSPFPSNWELSSARAASVARALQEHGISADRLTASGLAQTRPRASNDSEAGRRENRRITVIVQNN
ncbi:MAG: motB1 [Betaproteobacteria bacterium]|nr:motB1 [Betaproteobacteria bacterium]